MSDDSSRAAPGHPGRPYPPGTPPPRPWRGMDPGGGLVMTGARVNHAAEAREWLVAANTWFRNGEDTEAPQVAQAAALIALTHAVLDLSASVMAVGERP